MKNYLTDASWVNWVFFIIFGLGVLYALYVLTPQVWRLIKWGIELSKVGKLLNLIFWWRNPTDPNLLNTNQEDKPIEPK